MGDDRYGFKIEPKMTDDMFEREKRDAFDRELVASARDRFQDSSPATRKWHKPAQSRDDSMKVEPRMDTPSSSAPTVDADQAIASPSHEPIARERERFRHFEETPKPRKAWREPRLFKSRILRGVLRGTAYLGGALVAVSLAGVVAAYGLLKHYEPKLPTDGADLYSLNRPASYTIMNEKGERLGMRGAVVGERLKLGDMPPYLSAAFLTVEDRRFFSHPGIDVRGLIRAAVIDFTAGHYVQGGSTVTQQLVKTLILTPERTITRKITEISGAMELERRLPKEQILELYLNRIYLGSGAYGVDGAAQVYFGKSARDVTLAEAAMLAALTTAPSTFSPRHDLAMAQMRADRVLVTMHEEGTISDADLTHARAHVPTLIDLPLGDYGRDYFLDASVEEAKKQLGEAGGDFTIVTTFDNDMQKAAYTSLSTVMDKKAKVSHADQASLVAMATDGAVRAMIGGRNYADSAYNRVTQAHRQPGSSFKPIVYLTALESGLKPYTVRVDQPISIKHWSPDNYGGSFLGPVTLQEALTRSLNSVAVQLGQEVGLKKVIATARRLGIESPLQPYPSLPIGTFEVSPIEMIGVFGTFATAGLKTTPYTVLEIKDAMGTVTYKRDTPEQKRVIAEHEANALNGMLYNVVQHGTARAAALQGREVAGKTGTSTEFHDAWFFGFTSQMVAGVWVGNDDSTSMKKITGGSLPAQIWNGFMKVAMKNVPAVPLARGQHDIDYDRELVAQDDDSSFTQLAQVASAPDSGMQYGSVGDVLSRMSGSGTENRTGNAEASGREAPVTEYARNDPRAYLDRPPRQLKYNRYDAPGAASAQPPDYRYARSASNDYDRPPPAYYDRQVAGYYYDRATRTLRYNRYERPPPPPPPGYGYDRYGPPQRSYYYER